MGASRWTQERLTELVKLWPTMNGAELAEHFGVGLRSITQLATRLRKNGVPLVRKGRTGDTPIDYKALAKLVKANHDA